MLLGENYMNSIDLLLENNDESKWESFKDSIKTKSPNLKGAKDWILKQYATSPDNLARDLPDIGDLVRLTIIVGIPMSINPLFGIFPLLADKLIRDAANSKVISSYIRHYESEKSKFQKKLDKEVNPAKKKLLQDQVNELSDCINNLEDKRGELCDSDSGALNSTLKNANEKELEESFIIMRDEFNYLTESQFNQLFNEDILSEGIGTDVKMKAMDLNKSIEAKKDSMDNWFNDTLKSIKNGSTEQTKDDIVEGNFPKLSKMIRRAIVIGAVWAINPAIAALTAMCMFVLSKRGTLSQKKKLLSELKSELEVLEEKIKDADGKNDNQKKYELMRLRQKIQTNVDKIKDYI